MFDVGFSELLVIGIVALVVIGPEKLPKVARTIGHLLGRAQRYVNDVKSDINREIELDELRKLQTQMQEAARQVQTTVTENASNIEAEVNNTVHELKTDGLSVPIPEHEQTAQADHAPSEQLPPKASA